MINVPNKIVKSLLEVLDDIAWYLHYKEDDGAIELLTKLRKVKHNFEDHAKEIDGGYGVKVVTSDCESEGSGSIPDSHP